MNRTRILTTAAVLAAGAIAVLSSGVGAQDASPDDIEDRAEGPDVPITGPDLDRASAVALDFLGEGRVTATEVEDEESYYEVEVILDDGREIDVQLDESFDVVGTD